MKRETALEAKQRADRLQRENALLDCAIQTMVNDKPEHVERWKEGYDKYVAKMYKCLGAHGGILLIEFHYPGQRTQVTVRFLEEWEAERKHTGGLNERIAAEHFMAARKQIWTKQQEQR